MHNMNNSMTVRCSFAALWAAHMLLVFTICSCISLTNRQFQINKLYYGFAKAKTQVGRSIKVLVSVYYSMKQDMLLDSLASGWTFTSSVHV